MHSMHYIEISFDVLGDVGNIKSAQIVLMDKYY